MTAALLPVLVVTLAFIIGYTIRRGSICVVAATHAFVVQRRSKRLRAFAVAVAAAGLVVIPLHWALPDTAMLSLSYPASVTAVAAGGIYAIGARVNNACAFGTLGHLTGGRLVYAMTLVGAALGASVTLAFQPIRTFHDTPVLSSLYDPTPFAMAVVAVFLAIVLVTVAQRGRVWWQDLRGSEQDRLGPFRAMLIIGVFSGLLYAVMGGWTHMGLLSRHASVLAGQSAPKNDLLLWLSAAALFVGGCTAAVRTRQFQLRGPKLGEFTRCLIGGTLMGASAAVIPGGNGILLVHGLPSLASNAWTAYAVMTVILCITFLSRTPRAA
ncbi:MAG: YeeE/YedE thiosulfate transporter family protein [Pseudomonadota bacterium]